MVSFFRRRCEAAWQRFAAFSGSTESIKIKTESLGTQVVEGILADGTRITRTLAAGQAGNQHPLDIISETWYSNELQTVVLSKTTDPRRGENICRLTEIQRGEPLHSFFEIPADYTVRDEPQAPSVDTATRK